MRNRMQRGQRRFFTAAVLVTTFFTAPGAHAFQDVADEAKHFFECLGLMVGDPPAHSQQCLPNRGAVVFSSLSSPSEGAAPVVVLPPPVVVVTPPACVCGPCYPA